MRQVAMIGLLLVVCIPTLADDPFVDGKIREQEFWGSWDGPDDDLPSEAAGEAAQYIDDESDYIGHSCTSVFPAAEMYPCEWEPALHGMASITGGTVQGFTICSTGTIDSNGYCTGAMMMDVKKSLIDNQSLWCEELGHAFGAMHDAPGYEGCMVDHESVIYDPHHISEHLQYENGPPH